MKKLKNLIILPVVLALLVISANAAVAENVNTAPGKSAELTFKYENVYNVDGAFVIDDPQDIVEEYTISVVDYGSALVTISGNRLWAQPGGTPTKTHVSVAVQLKIKSDAAMGSQCTVAFSGIYGNADEEPGNEHELYESSTVTVGGAADTPIAGGENGDTPVQNPAARIDYRELEKNIAIAGGINQSEYTNESWENMSNVLSSAQYAMSSSSQSDVDAAAAALGEAIGALKKIDYSQLIKAVSKAEEFVAGDAMAKDWLALIEELEKASSLLGGNDQRAIDEAAEKINSLLKSLQLQLDEQRAPEVITKEVEVEVLPKDDYCNIANHRIWPILFVSSAVINVALVIVIIAYTIKKKKYHNDDTPLVDYDIDDDI